MKIQFAQAILTAALLSTSALAQVPTEPPMKMGLWEMTSKTDLAGKANIRTVRNCINQTNWLKMMGPTAKEACPKINEVWTASSYSFDVQCTGKPKFASINVHFDSPEDQHVSLDMLTTPDGAPLNLHHDLTGHWLGADCGNVEPGKPVVVSK
jgi:hypothetical protein